MLPSAQDYQDLYRQADATRRELRKRAEEETKTPPLQDYEQGVGDHGQSQYVI